jgi:ankyrin repeat protein
MKHWKLAVIAMVMAMALSQAAYPQKVKLTPEEQKELESIKRDASEESSTALHIAAREGELKICRYLLEVEGADVNAMDNDWDTPLKLAIRRGHRYAAAVLRKHGGEK